MQKVNLAQKLRQFSELWSPRIVGELNDQQVKVAKLDGEFVWHHHADEDELFLVVEGRLDIHFRDRVVSPARGSSVESSLLPGKARPWPTRQPCADFPW